MTQLEVQLTANIKNLKKQILEAEKLIKGFGDETDRQGGRGARGFAKFKKGAANVTPTMLEFNRVIQDAPFGIQGVANNLTQLTQNFGHLRQQAGGTRAALKLLLGSLSGPAGILFAISAITSLLVAFGDKLSKSKDKAEELSKSLEGINDLFDSELRLSKAIEKSLTLQGQSTDDILESRRELQREQVKNLQGLIQQQQELLNIQKLENQRVSNMEILKQEALTLWKFLIGQGKTIGDIVGSGGLSLLKQPLAEALNIEIDRSKYSAATLEDKQKEQELTTKLNNLRAQLLEIENNILSTKKKQTKESDKQLEAAKKEIAARQGGAAQNVLSTSGVTATPSNSIVSAPILTRGVQANLSEAQIGITEAWLGFRSNLNELFATGPVQGLTTFADTLGSALGQGASVISAVGSGILSAMGGFLSQFGKQLISYGIAALAFSKVTKALTNPITAGPAAGAAIAAGIALTAAGAALQSTLRGGFSGAGGFSGSGGSSFSGSSVSSFSSSGFNGRVVFEISGQKLIGVLNNSLSANQRLGGNISLG
ncbi:MAG: hypothetical protein NXH86_04050 [Flavobacteriaceae bacterium]|uniref:hypothetical protein n=1 Tax=Flagellimonas sp. SN16 TaxID=3415142 RepID=UPI003C68E9CF|nr:hypothetical protein [Flavobacteriaceae bacterium]